MTQLPAITRDRLHSAPVAVLTPRAAPASRDAQGPHQEGEAKNMPGHSDAGAGCLPFQPAVKHC